MARLVRYGTETSAVGGEWSLKPTFWVHVTSGATFDEKTGLWTYAYEIANSDSSQAVVELFGVTPIWSPPESIRAPEHWAGEYGYPIEDPRGLVWTIRDPGPPPPDWVDDGANTYPSMHGIAPGESLGGFTFSTPLPPAEISFTVQVWEEMEWAEDAGGDDEPYIPFFSSGATGMAVGPQHLPKR